MWKLSRLRTSRCVGVGAALCVTVYVTAWTTLHFNASHEKQQVMLESWKALSKLVYANATRRPKILCWLLTEQTNLDTRAKAVKETWTKRCDKVLFFSSKTNATFPTIGLNIPEGRSQLTAKVLLACTYSYKLYGDYFDWFLKADDDSYFVMENLRKFLASKDPQSAVYFGYRFKPYVPQGYMSGGAGYVLSREALKRLVVQGIVGRECREYLGVEDLDIGKCLHTVGVKAMDSIDEHGLETFHALNLNSYFNTFSLPDWTRNYAYHPLRRGYNCCSNHSISFHYMRPHEMYILEYLIYYLKHS